jgi:hypothetical protein
VLGFKHDHLELGFGAPQLIGRPQPSEAAANDADVGLAGLPEGRTGGASFDLGEPEGRRADGTGVGGFLREREWGFLQCRPPPMGRG